MLSTEANLAVQRDILPTQNIGILEQQQPEIFSLLPNSNSPLAMKQSRRKRTSKLDPSQPVTINPNLTRISTDIASNSLNNHPILSSECTSSYITPYSMNGYRMPIELCLGPSSHDTNNNVAHPQIGTVASPLNHSLAAQMQRSYMWPKESSPIVNINSRSSEVMKAQFIEADNLLKNDPNKRTVSIPSLYSNECNNYNSSARRIAQGSLSSPSHSIGSPTSLITESSVPPLKQKRKYSRKQHTLTTIDQSRICHYPISLMQPMVSSGLPLVIPASVTTAASKYEKYSQPTDISTSNFLPLSPPSSIKSPPTNIITESSVASIRSHLIPCTLPNIPDVRSESRQYMPDQRYPLLQRMNNDASFRNFSQLKSATHPQYCLIPSNVISPGILPMTCSSIVSGNIADTSLKSMPADKQERKSKVVQKSLVRTLENGESSRSKSFPKKTSVIKDRKHKHSITKDVRTKKQLRHLIRRNRLAVLKFIIQKRKQQKQKTVSIPTPTILDTNVEQAPIQQVLNNNTKVEEKTKPTLPDIIAPSLKVTFDANQKIESICLYYHRRRKPNRSNDNRLSLLIEAMELVETFQGDFKVAVPPNK